VMSLSKTCRSHDRWSEGGVDPYLMAELPCGRGLDLWKSSIAEEGQIC
jgi:hypothetical protein